MKFSHLVEFTNFILEKLDIERVSDIKNISLDYENNILTINETEYKIVALEDVEALLINKIKEDIKSYDFEYYIFLDELIYLVDYIDKNKLINYILENFDDIKEDLKIKGFKEKLSKESIKYFIDNINLDDLIFEYLETCDVIANCIFIDNDDIDNIIDEYEEEFLKFYLKLKKINEYLDYTKCAMFTSCILLFN